MSHCLSAGASITSPSFVCTKHNNLKAHARIGFVFIWNSYFIKERLFNLVKFLIMCRMYVLNVYVYTQDTHIIKKMFTVLIPNTES